MTQLPGPARVTPHGEQLLDAIHSKSREWVNRSQIAKALGKNRLTQWEIGLLTLLVKQEYIEAQKRPYKGIQGYEWVYRARSE